MGDTSIPTFLTEQLKTEFEPHEPVPGIDEIFTGIAIDVSQNAVRGALVMMSERRLLACKKFFAGISAVDTVQSIIDREVGMWIDPVKDRPGEHSATAFVNGPQGLRQLFECWHIPVFEWFDVAREDAHGPIIAIDEAGSLLETLLDDLTTAGPSDEKSKADFDALLADMDQVRVTTPSMWGGMSEYRWGSDNFDPQHVSDYHGWYLGALAMAMAACPAELRS